MPIAIMKIFKALSRGKISPVVTSNCIVIAAAIGAEVIRAGCSRWRMTMSQAGQLDEISKSMKESFSLVCFWPSSLFPLGGNPYMMSALRGSGGSREADEFRVVA